MFAWILITTLALAAVVYPVKRIHALATGRVAPGDRPRAFAGLSGFFLLATAAVYLWGLLFACPVLLDMSRKCSDATRTSAEVVEHRPDDLRRVERRYLPLKSRCVWSDGTTTDTVPGYINAALLPLATGSLASAFLCGQALLKQRTREGIS
ncbi:hypothetical protein ACIHFE_19115 [Streptomyces sp. NPDC052396]|uniref:hypothetical protein n=1 Tax=Streptomyces sp. NPDC052396 TaxID=3365689 RepID=UPI0037D1B06F